MEWRQQTNLSCEDAFDEARRWIQEVTGKPFGCGDFRAALENGVLLCDLINQLKPGIIKKLNRLSTPIAGLDNVNVFLKACGKLGLNESQLFHPGDLQDMSIRVTLRRDESNRRLKNVLITIYWLGRKARLDPFYRGPQLNFKAFEGRLGLGLSKTPDEISPVSPKGGGYRGSSVPEWNGLRSYRRENSANPTGEGCGSDAEAEQVFRVEKTLQWDVPPPREREGRTGGFAPFARRRDLQLRPGSAVRSAQVNPGWIWSKSLSDIPMAYPVCRASWGSAASAICAAPGERRAVAKDSEAQWQDDLTKWKNRRRSAKSDPRRKSQDREHVMSRMTNGAVTGVEDRWTGGELSKRCSTSPPSESSSSCFQSNARAGPAAQGSSAGDTPASDGNVLGEERSFLPLPSKEAPGLPLGSAPFQDPEGRRAPEAPVLYLDVEDPATVVTAVDASQQMSEAKETFMSACEMQSRGLQAAGASGSSSAARSWSNLLRGFRRSEGAPRLSSVITARPFGTKQSRVSSLPRMSNTGDNQGLPLHEKRGRSTSPLLLKRHSAPPDRDQIRTRGGPVEDVKGRNGSSGQADGGGETRPPPKVDHADKRASLRLKLHTTPDSVSQRRWASAAARARAGSPAELYQLRDGDEMVAVDGAGDQREDKMASGGLNSDVGRNGGGSESAISDLKVPSLSPSPSSWSWDSEEDLRRQEKWQEEQERLLQEQNQREQRRLEAQWQKEQQDAGVTEVTCGVLKQPDVDGRHPVNGTRGDERRPEVDLGPPGGMKAQPDQDRVQDTCGLVQLSPAHRTKSLSTPSLSGPHKHPPGGWTCSAEPQETSRPVAGDQKKRKDGVSKAEQERQQILEEMKKRTQLLTDSSWIRQRAAVPLKRYESLDHLDQIRQPPLSAVTPGQTRPHSAAAAAAAGYSSPAKSRSRYSTGSISSPRGVSMSSNLSRPSVASRRLPGTENVGLQI